MKISNDVVVGLIRKLVRDSSSSYQDDAAAYLASVVDAGFLMLPVPVETVFVFEHRIPVFQDVRSGKRSLLINQLAMRTGDTALVVDTVRHGKGALFLCACEPISGREAAQNWASFLQPDTSEMYIYAQQLGLVLLATLGSFVVNSGE